METADQATRDDRPRGGVGRRSPRRRGIRVGGFWRAMGLLVALSSLWTLLRALI